VVLDAIPEEVISSPLILEVHILGQAIERRPDLPSTQLIVD